MTELEDETRDLKRLEEATGTTLDCDGIDVEIVSDTVAVADNELTETAMLGIIEELDVGIVRVEV